MVVCTISTQRFNRGWNLGVLYNTVKTILKFCVLFLEGPLLDATYGFSAPYHGKGSQDSNITCIG